MIEMLAGEGTVKREFPGKYILYKRFGIDISKQPMLIYPTLHYQNGGLEFQNNGESPLPGLFVAGEVGGGIHGANRLMGNSLLDYNVFGRRAGRAAAREILAGAGPGAAISLDHAYRHGEACRRAGLAGERRSPLLLPDYQDRRRALGTRSRSGSRHRSLCSAHAQSRGRGFRISGTCGNPAPRTRATPARSDRRPA